MTELSHRLDELAQRTRDAIRPGLDGIRALDAAVGTPSQALHAVVVAGTNGKGTCCRALEAIAGAHGLRTGLFTSPHRSRFNQRFRLAGVDADDATVLAWLDAVDRPGATFFEVSTAMAFYGFASQAVDLAILEVGMGGRLDAVNLVDGAAAAVVSISRDHEFYLGSGLEAIAAEKLGVARPGRPLVLGPGCTPFSAAAAATGAEVLLNGRDWRSDKRSVETQTLTMNRPDHLLLDALWDAAAVAVPLAQALGLDEPAAVEEGLQRFRHPLRGERMGGVTFDACHNEAGIRQFARWAQRMAPDADLLVGLSGRDPEVLAPLCGSGRSWFTVAAEHPKATEAEGLAQALRARGEEAVALSRSEAAALLRRKVAGKTDSLLAFGSIYAFGPLRDALQSQLR